MHLTLAVLGVLSFIIMMEIFLWLLMKHQVDPLCFPADAQRSWPKRTHMRSLRIFVVLHTFFLSLLSGLYLGLLW